MVRTAGFWVGVILSVSALAGCIRSEVSQIDDRTAIISTRGTAFDTPAGVQLGAMVQAAKSTKARGYRYFGLVNAQDASTSSMVFVPGQTATNTTVTGFGNTAYATSNSYTTPGSAFPVVKPGQDIMIKMFRDGEISPATQGIWDADSILAAQPAR